ncbi:MAG TPA: hypothetical protein VFE76_10345 [Myxococcales bacterium]|jgi:hypothetical protein|nr:hypothetical protein [Myxococcales bacterium]
MKMRLRKKKSLARRVFESNELTGMVVRYVGLAVIVVMVIFEIPAFIRYMNIERM